MVFHWSLSDSKFPQVSRTRLRILAVLSNAVVWIVSVRPPIFKSSRPFNNPLVIVPNAPITIGTIVTFMFHSFFNSLARSKVLIFHFTLFQIYSVVRRDGKVNNFTNFLYYYYYYYYYERAFYFIFCRWDFTGVRGTASFFRSIGPF